MPWGTAGEISISDSGEEIERFDKKLGELMPLLKKEDLLMITADHGNDPTYKGTDHTREQVPLLLYSPSGSGKWTVPTQDIFAVIGATNCDIFLECRCRQILSAQSHFVVIVCRMKGKTDYKNDFI